MQKFPFKKDLNSEYRHNFNWKPFLYAKYFW